MAGRSPSGSGSRASHEAASASSPEASIPNAFAELAERCEQAAGPDRALDRAIWLAVVADEASLRAYNLGLKISKKEAAFRLDYMSDGARYTASLDAAKALCAPRTLWAVGSMEDGPFARLCWPMPNGGYGGGYVEGQAESAPLSLCAAALRGHAIAMEAREGPDRETGLDGNAATARPEGIAQ